MHDCPRTRYRVLIFTETGSRTRTLGLGEAGDGESLLSAYRVAAWGDENVLETDGGAACTNHVNFTLYTSYQILISSKNFSNKIIKISTSHPTFLKDV